MQPKKRDTKGTGKPGKETFEDTIPRDLREPLISLQKHEKTILRVLNSDPEMGRLFLTDPGTALARMKIPADPVVRKRASLPGQPDILSPRRFCLPGGKVIAPRVRVNFVAHSREG